MSPVSSGTASFHDIDGCVTTSRSSDWNAAFASLGVDHVATAGGAEGLPAGDGCAAGSAAGCEAADGGLDDAAADAASFVETVETVETVEMVAMKGELLIAWGVNVAAGCGAAGARRESRGESALCCWSRASSAL